MMVMGPMDLFHERLDVSFAHLVLAACDQYRTGSAEVHSQQTDCVDPSSTF